MSTAIKVSDKLVSEARMQAKIQHRSMARQIEYWADIGRIAEENPDLPISFIKGLLIGMKEAEMGLVEPYVFGEGD